MATHSSTLAWKIPWMEEPGRLQPMESLRVGTTERHFSLSCSGEGNGNPLQYSCLENPMDRGAWWATVHGVAKSRTRLSNFISLLLHGQSGKEQWCGGQRNLAQPQEEIQTKDIIVHPRA